MTLAEKILARASGREEVSPGETVPAAVDLAASPGNASEVRRLFLGLGGEQVWDADRVAIVLEQLASDGSGASYRVVRAFARQQQLRHFYDIGRGGACHQVVAENGHVLPGMLVVGTSRHTTAYGAYGALAFHVNPKQMAVVWKDGRLDIEVPCTTRIKISGSFQPWISVKDLVLWLAGNLETMKDHGCIEFAGPAVPAMSISSRIVLTGLAPHIGAVSAFTLVDDTLLTQLARLAGTPLASSPMWAPDSDASYARIITVDLNTELNEPQVRCHGKAEGVFPLSKIEANKVDMAVLGSCSNGRTEDFAMAARILAGRRVHSGTRLLVIPASQPVYLEALRHGYLQELTAAGAVILPPGCGAITSMRHGMMCAGETCISTTGCSYDAAGRGKRQIVYEAGPALVAAAAVAGRIVHPEEVVEESAA